MKAQKKLLMFLVACLCLALPFALAVAAEDGVDTAKKMDTFTLVSLIVLGVVVVAVIVYCIVRRQKVAATMRAYKSEVKKITWFPWKLVWRSTVLVIVVVLATALLIGLLDIAFFEGQHLLAGQGYSPLGGS